MVESPNAENELLLVGYVRKSHGVRGEVSIRLTTNRTERVNPGTVLHVGDTPYTISSSRPNNDDFLVKFEGVLDRNAADQLRGEDCLLYTSDAADE